LKFIHYEGAVDFGYPFPLLFL